MKILSYAQHSASVDEFNDPASWDSASYLDDPIDHLEPLEFGLNPYRERSLNCLAIVKAIDVFMSEASEPRLAWIGVSIALGLSSTQGMTVVEIARQLECSEQMVRGSTARFLKLSGLPPAGGKFAPWI